MNEIKAGDVVMLASLGPWMTVASVNGTVVRCLWFVDVELHAGDFSVASLLVRKPEVAKA